MRAHKFAEAIAKMDDFPALPSDFPMALSDIIGSVQFDFGDVTSIPNDEWLGLQDYAIELIDANMLRMPFERCFYTYKADGLDFSTLIVERRGRIFCLVAIGEPGCSLAFIAHIEIWTEPHEIEGKFKLGSTTFFSKNFRVYYYEPERQRAFADETSTVASRNIFALTMMLSANGVEQRITPAPHKLNKQRAKSGKQPIGEVREIIIRHGKKTYSASGREYGAHASPRLHWRRGHLRKLPSGKLTNVRPCLVGSIGEAHQPAYVVERVA